jgi:hypothetical protein
MLNDYVTSLIRTWTPVGIGLALTWLAREWGVVLDESTSAAASGVAVALVSGLYYAAVRALEAVDPRIGRWLLALGAGGTPSYERPRSPSR